MCGKKIYPGTQDNVGLLLEERPLQKVQERNNDSCRHIGFDGTPIVNVFKNILKCFPKVFQFLDVILAELLALLDKTTCKKVCIKKTVFKNFLLLLPFRRRVRRSFELFGIVRGNQRVNDFV